MNKMFLEINKDIFITSDLHLNHNKPFIYEARGFKNIKEHDKGIVDRWNDRVSDDSDIIILGDIVMGNVSDKEVHDYLKSLLLALKGNISFVMGNHDFSENKLKLYEEVGFTNLGASVWARYNKTRIALTHYPLYVDHSGETHNPDLNFFGHTHQSVTPFLFPRGQFLVPYAINAGVDFWERPVKTGFLIKALEILNDKQIGE